MIKNEPIFKEFITDRNLSKSSEKIYYKALKRYTQTQNQTLTQLYQEADNEEEQRIRLKNRKLKKRLKNYRQWLIDENYKQNVIKDYFGKVKTFYTHFEIEIPKLPPIQYPKEYHKRYDDIPTIEHIKTAIESTNNPKHKAIILFIASSGSSRDETSRLTVKDFINATQDYHNETNINNIIPILEKEKDIIPIFEMTRNKTDYPYYTCCSPEATQMIIKFLKKREKLQPYDSLFDLKAKSITDMFNRINKNNKWGIVDNYGFFHPHNLRTFHATAIEDVSFANYLQGRKSDSITETYFKHNPKRIKEKYLEHLPKLTINKTIVNSVDSEASKELKKQLEIERKARLEAENRMINAESMAREANRKIDEFINNFQE